MKVKKLIILSGLLLSLVMFSGFRTVTDSNDVLSESLIQEGFVVYATYNGQGDNNYNFVVKDRNGGKQTLVFQKVDAAVLTAFDLKAKTFVGTMFKITFNKGDDDTNTITKLENLPNY